MERLSGDAILTDASLIEGFKDDQGHRRAVDRHFLAAMHGVDGGPCDVEREPDDVAMWAMAQKGWVEEVPGEGPVTTWRDEPLEVWTEMELSVLHALWRSGRIGGRASVRERLLDCARWHVRETQPDNATAHPWAIHVFVILGEAEARLYAEGLLHACQVGGLDRFSALILLDAARELELEAATT